MSAARGRHVRPAPRRRALLAVAATVLAAGAAGVVPATTATAADACSTPVVTDFMVSQGLPSYAVLTRGKTTLVKYFLAAPSCLPRGASIRITKGSLLVSTSPLSVPLTGVTPLPPVGPLATAPVPAAASDPLFVVPGSMLLTNPTDRTPVSFTATLEFTTTYADSSTQPVNDKLVVTQRADGTAVAAVVERASNSLRVLTVPMGDAGTVTAPKTADSQFPGDARTGLAAGMTSVNRVLPVADGVGDLQPTGAASGLRYAMSAGMLNLGSHTEDGVSGVNYMAGGSYCGDAGHYNYISTQLYTALENWNSMNKAAPADVVYGTVWGGISAGPHTDARTCIEGYADVNGTAAWGRVIPERTTDPKRPAYTGSIAEMELLHTTGAVIDKTKTAAGVARGDTGYHSTNDSADVTAPARAWNTATQEWIGANRSAMRYYTDTSWNDKTTLLEKPDYDLLLCRLTPVPAGTPTTCPSPGTIGRAAAGAGAGSAFFVAGSTDGTPGGTDLHTYLDDDVNYNAPAAGSEYRFVQRNVAGAVVADDGVQVSFAHSHHDDDVDEGTTTARGAFGTEVQATPTTTRIELWHGAPGAAGSVLLYRRDRDAPPQFLGVSAQGNSVSVSATDDRPEDLRLDLFLACPEGTSPLVNALKPVVAGRTAAFVTRYDTSLGCPDGTLVYRVSDGYLTAEQRGATPEPVGLVTGTAAIYSPTADMSPTQGKVLALAGDGRDATDAPAAQLLWRLTGPSYPTGKELDPGRISKAVPPEGGWVPGAYSLTLTAKNRNGDTVATTTRTFAILSDQDRDFLDDPHDQEPCFPAGSVSDPATPVLDSDGDGIPNINDTTPCTSSLTAAGNFSPTSLQRTSSGNPVTVNLTASQVDLRTLSTADLQIVQIAGHRLATPIPALSWAVTDATTGTVKFDRTALCQVLNANKLLGYVPVVVAAPRVGLRAIDPTSPTVFP